jgi:alpha/beta superfamily hydrolase
LAQAQAILPYEKYLNNSSDYHSEEISFYNRVDRLFLSGTLVCPKDPFAKIVVIAPGSGKDTRNSHYQLVSKLLDHNIAVYRFDDRGVGKSQGVYSNSVDVLSQDIRYCIRKLKKLHKDKTIGVIGHSLGGMAAIIANENLSATNEVEFLVQIATPVKNFSEVTRYQLSNLDTIKNNHLLVQNQHILFNSLMELIRVSSLQDDYKIYQKGISIINKSTVAISEIHFWSVPHISLYKKDLESFYRKLKTPTFYLVGEKDRTVNPHIEIQNLKNYNNSNISYFKLKNLNHYLSRSYSNNSEIYNIDNTATNLILDWLDKI